MKKLIKKLVELNYPYTVDGAVLQLHLLGTDIVAHRQDHYTKLLAEINKFTRGYKDDDTFETLVNAFCEKYEYSYYKPNDIAGTLMLTSKYNENVYFRLESKYMTDVLALNYALEIADGPSIYYAGLRNEVIANTVTSLYWLMHVTIEDRELTIDVRCSDRFKDVKFDLNNTNHVAILFCVLARFIRTN